MGFVMLIGIVVNNAILIMDRFNVLFHDGVPRHQAMIQAACDRFRPVLMITMAAVLGMLPMAIGQGIGATEPKGWDHQLKDKPILNLYLFIYIKP